MYNRRDRRSPGEISEPQPVIVTEYKIAHYAYPHCQKEVVATDAGCPKEGRFGNNTIAQAALLKLHNARSNAQTMAQERIRKREGGKAHRQD
jgi:hypothetical protein